MLGMTDASGGAAPRAIVHIDGDAFFASCEQATHPEWRGRAVITGKERGIVSAASYEAKARGVSRGTPLWDVKKIIPDAIIVPSDYETYSLFSKRMFEIMRRFTSEVEEYSIDEGFCDITGLDRPMGCSYEEIVRRMKRAIESELGITVSAGLSCTKTLAKVGSKWKKPSGLTVIPREGISKFLSALPVGKVWGLGPATAHRCIGLGLATAQDFAAQDEKFIRCHFARPQWETWRELNGLPTFPLETELKDTYNSIGKSRTFTPPSTDREFVFAQLLKNLENACIKARRHHLAARGLVVYLRRQDFRHDVTETALDRATAFPMELTATLRQLFGSVYRPRTEYRATGVVLTGLVPQDAVQLSIFEPPAEMRKMEKLYAAMDQLAATMGKHCVFSAAAAAAHGTPQHILDRGNVPQRKLGRLKGETRRRHLRLPVMPGGAV